jgi:dipeptidase E
MICFLTSRTDEPETGRLNPANHFADELRRRYPRSCSALFLCSDPDSWETTDFYAAMLKKSFEDAGFVFQSFRTLDGRNEAQAAELVTGANLFILAGGHVPTQNRFFQRIGLKELMADAAGIVIGISAGSMNSAETVYAQPELDGEASDPAYQRFLPGLGLTKTMLLPHYQALKDAPLDGLRVMEDITYPDSMGRIIYAIPDGSYLLIDHGREELRGEAYAIRDGVRSRISDPCGAVTL